MWKNVVQGARQPFIGGNANRFQVIKYSALLFGIPSNPPPPPRNRGGDPSSQPLYSTSCGEDAGAMCLPHL